MKKSILILILSLFVVNCTEFLFHKDYSPSLMVDRQAVEHCDYYFNVNLKVEKSWDIKNKIDTICKTMISNGIDVEIVNEDVMKDIYEKNACYIYCREKDEFYNLIFDVKLQNAHWESAINLENSMALKLTESIRDVFQNSILDINVVKNAKLQLNSNYSFEFAKEMVTKYLSNLQYEFRTENIPNAFAIEVMGKSNYSNKFLISVAKYKDKVVIICGEPYIYVSY